MNTAQELFSTLQQLPLSERQQFFELLAGGIGNDASQENYSHAQVFGHLDNALFTAAEAADYLEISIATLRRYVRDNKIVATSTVGSSHLYSLEALRELKKALALTRRP
jgi:excisionase family DNA binding protein